MRTKEGQTGKDFHTLKDVCDCMPGESEETCGMSRSGLCSMSPRKWNHPRAHRENHWSSEYQRRTWCAGGGVAPWMTSPVCPSPSSWTGRGVGSSASTWLGQPHMHSPCHSCLSWELQPDVRMLRPLGTSHWSMPKRLRNGEKGALSRRLVKEPQPEHDLNQCCCCCCCC